MKKEAVIIINIFLVMAFMFITPLSSALESCDDPVIRGDADGDSRLTLTDGIRILDFLFRGGPAPECTEAADFNEDGSVNIADVIKLFSFLFQGGPGPINPYFEGVDNPPLLGFNWVIPEERLTEEQDEIPEIKTQVMPTTILVGDASGEPDMKECSATVTEVNSNEEPTGEPKLFFESKWDINPKVEFKDLSREPLELVIEQTDLNGVKNKIAVTCTDEGGQSNTIEM